MAGWYASVAGVILLALAPQTPASIAAQLPSSGELPPRRHNGTVTVARRGWHIDLGFAVDELAPPLHAVADVFPGARYLLFGFGDRRYLTAGRRGAPLLLRALWPGPGLLLVTALRAPPKAAFGAAHVVNLTVSREGSLRAQAFVWQSMTAAQQAALGEDTTRSAVAGSRPTPPGRGAEASGIPGPYASGIPGPYEGSRFFESRQTYSAAYTCNTWAAIGLGITGAPVKSHGVMFAGQLWDQLRPARLRAGGGVTEVTLPPAGR